MGKQAGFRAFWGALLVAAFWAAGCGEGFVTDDCFARRTCPLAAGQAGHDSQSGEGGVDSSPTNHAGGEPAASGGSLTGTEAGASDGVGGANESGASGANAGAGGAAGSSLFVGCDGKPFEGNEDVLRSCILRVGCQPWTFPADTISRCLSENTQQARDFQRCSLGATSCADIASCTGQTSKAAFCSGKAAGTYCDGADLVLCGDFPFGRDCSKQSGYCHEFGVDIEGPGMRAACVFPAIMGCDADTLKPVCGGPGNAYTYTCQDHLAYGTKCSAFGQSCSDDETIGCVPPHDCFTAAVACSDNIARVCDGTTKAEFDCGSVGLKCATTGKFVDDDAKHCVAPGCTREDLSTCKEHCDGTQLNLCYGGSKVSVDCRDYGFKKCSEYEYTCDWFPSGDCINSADAVKFATCE